MNQPIVNLDGTWSLFVNNLVENTENTFTITARNETGSTDEVIVIAVDTVSPSLSINSVMSPTDTATQEVSGLLRKAQASLFLSTGNHQNQ